MVTDVYSHIMNDDRKRLAKKINDHFFASREPAETKTAASEPSMGASMEQLMQLLKNSPEIVEPLLQMSKVLGEKA